MNYQKIYDSIVKKAKTENRIKNKEIYYELHHILPKCLGGKDDKENKVFLTFREHFICHWLLCKIHKNYKTNYYKLATAFRRMCSKNIFQKRDVLSKHYEITKMHERNVKRGVAIGGAKIKKRSEEWKKNISKSLMGRPNTWMKNKTYNEIYKKEDLEKIIESRKKSKNKNTITINDGKFMKFIDKNSSIPEGWCKGRIKLNITKKWYNNGIVERCFNVTQNIAEEWKLGRLKNES
jgi:hypothetical protein